MRTNSECNTVAKRADQEKGLEIVIEGFDVESSPTIGQGGMLLLRASSNRAMTPGIE
jgi:hypothetical protein